MKILQVAQLWESVPPNGYGGVERVVSYLTEELVGLGHEVTLLASGDSITSAKLETICPKALRLNEDIISFEAPLITLLERAFGSAAKDYDVIHSHLDFLGFPLIRRCPIPVITTIHGWIDIPELRPVFTEFADIPIVSISHAQRRIFPFANWMETVYHGIPEDLFTFQDNASQYLVFIGRICRDEGVEDAINVALRAKIPIKIIGRIDPHDRNYFIEVIEPLLNEELIEYMGEVSDTVKHEILRDAQALICSSVWPEAFGLVVIEALACGTPVLGYNRGSLPELIDSGVTGYVCENVSEMIAALTDVPRLRRRACRSAFEKRFTVNRMVMDYLNVYRVLRNLNIRQSG
jgi:glycosyltransferase involved in cell wall biosynthesis